jgi:hypothetical protein
MKLGIFRRLAPSDLTWQSSGMNPSLAALRIDSVRLYGNAGSTSINFAFVLFYSTIGAQPQTHLKYQFVIALYSSLALFETANRVLQLIENKLLASLIIQTASNNDRAHPATP